MNIQPTKAFGMEFSTPLMNAAGTVKNVSEAEKLLGTDLGAIVIGSITMESRTGNDAPNWHPDDHFALNSLGMPNPGIAYWEKEMIMFLYQAHQCNKKVILNIAGFNEDDYCHLVMRAFNTEVDFIEINFGCPNIISDGHRKPIFSFNIPLMKSTLEKLASKKSAGLRKSLFDKLIVKLSPYSDPDMLDDAITMLCEMKIAGITLCNTMPKSFAYSKNMQPSIKPDSGLAGLSGKALKPISLGRIVMAKQKLEILGKRLDIIGTGGIYGGLDMIQYEQAGASLMQIGTAYIERNSDPSLFGYVLAEYYEQKNKEEVSA